MSSKFGQIQPLVSMATDRDTVNVFDWIHFILAGNDDIHKSLDEFEIRPDPTTGFHGNR